MRIDRHVILLSHRRTAADGKRAPGGRGDAAEHRLHPGGRPGVLGPGLLRRGDRHAQPDLLAAGGVRFTQFYNGTRCCPSRASLLTGLYPHQAGVVDMLADRGRRVIAAPRSPNAVTLAEACARPGIAR
ncbi:MAG: sulfatase-like hydrolase/transferase [Gemmataceae bacterium]